MLEKGRGTFFSCSPSSPQQVRHYDKLGLLKCMYSLSNVSNYLDKDWIQYIAFSECFIMHVYEYPVSDIYI